MASPEELLQTLTRLSLEDPAEGRRVLREAISNDAQSFEGFLGLLNGPSHSRLRNLVANVAIRHERPQLFTNALLDWREKETDEFSRRAIVAALAKVDERLAAPQPRTAPTTDAIAETYNYIARRLNHRLRNTLFGAQAQLLSLRERVESGSNLNATIGALEDSFLRLSKSLGAIEVDPAHFAKRFIVLVDWLKEMHSSYCARYSRVGLTFSGSQTALVEASDYLLDLIFWNIWVDAHQSVAEVSSSCEIFVNVEEHDGMTRIVIADNGAGFPSKMRDIAFEDQYSTKSQHRGEGLLEVRAAVSELRGAVKLIEREGGDLRIRLSLPGGQ